MSQNNNELSAFEATFGAGANGSAPSNAPSNSRADKPKAQVWMNIGYEIDSSDKDGNAIVEFIALPGGIALDTMEKLPANQRDAYFQKKQQASNVLLDKVLAMAGTLKPGEEKIIGARGSLQIQIRRIKAEAEIVDQASNTLIADLVL